jgi:glutamate--cysteine ligase
MTRTRATEAAVVAKAARAFTPTRDVRIGAEVEWLVYDCDDPTKPISATETASVAAGPLPAGGMVTIEPGGQLELVTTPLPDPRRLIDTIETHTAVLVERFAAHGLALLPLGLDPIRSPCRTLDRPRYQAMEQYFSARFPAGLRMMNLTASLQLNIDFGPDPATVWRRAHVIAPVLSAAFANSPTADGSAFHPVSHRQRIWADTDPSRTRPVGPDTGDWAGYVLDAQVMMRSGLTGLEPVATAMTFHEWLGDADPPSDTDLDLHLTTLFPPLRPRSFLELRMIDALPTAGRAAAIAAVWTVLTDDDAGADATEACRMLVNPWQIATERGLQNDALRDAAMNLLDVAASAVRPQMPELANACRSWRDNHIRPQALAGSVSELLESTER